jgi:hypothetical protein
LPAPIETPLAAKKCKFLSRRFSRSENTQFHSRQARGSKITEADEDERDEEDEEEDS